MAKYMAYFETSGEGLQWSNIHHSPMSDDDFTVLIAMLMMMVGMAIFGILSWYIANICPGESQVENCTAKQASLMDHRRAFREWR